MINRTRLSLGLRHAPCALSLSVAAALALLGNFSATAYAQTLPYSTGFEGPGFAPGPIDSQGGWGTFGAATATVTTAAAHTGTQSLLFSNGGDSLPVGASTPLFAPSGETPSIFVPNPASNFMSEDFWFRTVATGPDPGLYVSTSLGNPASVRNTWFGVGEGSVFGGMSNDLYVAAYSVDPSGNFIESLGPALAWGQWYHATIDETYVNGPNNDIVTYSVEDSSNTPIWSVTVGSWENYYATTPSAEQSPGPVISDRASFGGMNGGEGIYVDDFSMSNTPSPVPEPSSVVLAGLGLLGMAGYALTRRRRQQRIAGAIQAV